MVPCYSTEGGRYGFSRWWSAALSPNSTPLAPKHSTSAGRPCLVSATAAVGLVHSRGWAVRHLVCNAGMGKSGRRRSSTRTCGDGSRVPQPTRSSGPRGARHLRRKHETAPLFSAATYTNRQSGETVTPAPPATASPLTTLSGFSFPVAASRANAASALLLVATA